MSDDLFPGLNHAIDVKSYEWLLVIAPAVASAVERGIANGATPQQAAQAVAKSCSAYDGDFSALVESAARYMKGIQVRA